MLKFGPTTSKPIQLSKVNESASAINEETWEQERAGRLHHAHCRFEIVLNGQTILEFLLTVLPHG